jgi:Ser/Thr protein kinase RdoA (MazF antagonist)
VDGEAEEILAGGNLTRVTRVGDTVRREAGPWTTSIHRLLGHLHHVGFTLAPQALGIDGSGREILSYIAGETLTGATWPEWVWSESLLEEAVSALADYHRKVSSYRPTHVESRLGIELLGDDEIVCHNDFAPYNCVFRDGHLVGLIDWDVTCAGHPSWDLAFFAWHWVPLYAPSPDLAWRTPSVSRHRLRRIVDAYGLPERAGFLAQIVRRVEASQQVIVSRAVNADPVFRRLEQEGHVEQMRLAIDYIRANEALFADALVA